MADNLVTQPSAAPTNKVSAAGIAGAAVTVVLGVLDALTAADFHGAWWGGAVASVCAFAAGYLRKNKIGS